MVNQLKMQKTKSQNPADNKTNKFSYLTIDELTYIYTCREWGKRVFNFSRRATVSQSVRPPKWEMGRQRCQFWEKKGKKSLTNASYRHKILGYYEP